MLHIVEHGAEPLHFVLIPPKIISFSGNYTPAAVMIES